MSDQLDLFGPTRQSRLRRQGGRGACRVPGCHTPHVYGKARCYCAEHECGFDSCARLVVDRGRCRIHAYCAVEGCPNMRRQASAAKYCEDHATCIDYAVTGEAAGGRRVVEGACLVCGSVTSSTVATGRALLLCRTHRHLREYLSKIRKVYRLEDDRLRSLLTEPTCWICGGDLSWRFTSFAFSGGAKAKEKVHVDHDHRCCSGFDSCGSCVRGFAHDRCNRYLGFVEKLADLVGDDRLFDIVRGRRSER